MNTHDDWLLLDSDEVVQWSDHPHLTVVLPRAVLGAILVVIGIAVLIPAVSELVVPSLLDILLMLLVPVGIVLPLRPYLSIMNTRFVVTDQALYVKRGILSRRVEQIGIDSIQNSSYSQEMRGAILGYGTVSIETAGSTTTIRFHNIANPQTVYALIDRQTTEDDGIPGTIEQWEAILAEVRTLRSMLETRNT
jgi:uncharacterized membrane protein YdbT with pleckstrin-like domain